jgi:putative hydrolase of the HAD superfamily
LAVPRRAIEAVLLDVGGVLLVPDHAVYRPVLQEAGLTPDAQTIDRGHYAGIVATEPCDAFDWAAYFEALAITCGAPAATVAAVAAALRATWERPRVWSRVLPGALDGLAHLIATGAAIAMVSNSDGTAEESLRLARVCQVGAGPDLAVHVVIDSHVVGVEKPDPRIFEITLETLCVAPGAAVHVGDTVRYDVDGARSAGILPLHLDPFGLCPDRLDHQHVRSLRDVADLVAARPSRR